VTEVDDPGLRRQRTERAAPRLSAPERREAIVAAALRVFSEGSYAGATTAQIAREAGISEPILYRHFGSKKELYFACLDAVWGELRDSLRAKMDELGPIDAWRELGPSTMRRLKAVVPNLWMQAITEAGEDPEIRRFVRRHMREVHDFFADALRRLQDAGGIPHDRDPNAEAWVFLGGSLLASFADRLGGLLSEDDFQAIKTQRWRWLSGAG
jgi:TetR/AcrR family transcriptional regulator